MGRGGEREDELAARRVLVGEDADTACEDSREEQRRGGASTPSGEVVGVIVGGLQLMMVVMVMVMMMTRSMRSVALNLALSLAEAVGNRCDGIQFAGLWIWC